jgi:hypothetical protein
MTAHEALQLQPGDRVRADGWRAEEDRKVREVKARLFPKDPMVFFVGGGYWRASGLRKVEEGHETQRSN